MASQSRVVRGQLPELTSLSPRALGRELNPDPLKLRTSLYAEASVVTAKIGNRKYECGRWCRTLRFMLLMPRAIVFSVPALVCVCKCVCVCVCERETRTVTHW